MLAGTTNKLQRRRPNSTARSKKNTKMKLRKSRTATRASAEPEGSNFGNALTTDYAVRKSRTTSFGLFDTFRKSNNNNNNKSVDDDEMRLLKKGSYAQSERTEPTDALTAMSETMSVASEEINTALNRTFAIFRNPSNNQPGQEILFVDDFPTGEHENGNGNEEEEEGHFANVHNKSHLNKESLSRLAALETASHFSDPKNKRLRKNSLKIIEMRTEPPRIIDGDVAITDFEAISAIDAPSGSEVTFDPDKYLLEAESRYKDPAPMLADEYGEEGEEVETSLDKVEVGEEEGEGEVQKNAKVKENAFTNEDVRDKLTSALSVGARIPSPNQEYISDASSDGEDEKTTKSFREKRVTSPLHSPGSSSSSASSDWGKESTETREVSLLDVIFDKKEENQHDDDDDDDDNDGAGEDSDDDDGSSSDFDDEEIGTDDEGAGTVEGPASPNSRGSSIILEEYEELDAIAALSGMFMNLVSCNIDDLASSIVIGDDDDDYSLNEGEDPAADTSNTGANAQRSATGGWSSIFDHFQTPHIAPPNNSLWSVFGSNCSS